MASQTISNRLQLRNTHTAHGHSKPFECKIVYDYLSHINDIFIRNKIAKFMEFT